MNAVAGNPEWDTYEKLTFHFPYYNMHYQSSTLKNINTLQKHSPYYDIFVHFNIWQCSF